MIATGKLTVKQKRFIEEYLTDLNATQAAIRAGYSKRTARQQGALNMANVAIGAAIAEAMEKRSERTGVTADAVLARFWDIATADPNEIVSVRVGKCGGCYGGESDKQHPDARCDVCGGAGISRVVIADTKSLRGAALSSTLERSGRSLGSRFSFTTRRRRWRASRVISACSTTS